MTTSILITVGKYGVWHLFGIGVNPLQAYTRYRRTFEVYWMRYQVAILREIRGIRRCGL